MPTRTLATSNAPEQSRYDRLHFSALRAVARLSALDEPTVQEFERVRARGLPLRESMREIARARPRPPGTGETSHHATRPRPAVVRRTRPNNALLRSWQHFAVMALRSLL